MWALSNFITTITAPPLQSISCFWNSQPLSYPRIFRPGTRDGLTAAALLEIYQEASKKPDALLRTRTVKV